MAIYSERFSVHISCRKMQIKGKGMKRKPSVPAEYLALLRDYRREEKEKKPVKKTSQSDAKPKSDDASDSELEFEDVKIDNDHVHDPPYQVQTETHEQNDEDVDEYGESEEEFEDVSLNSSDADNVTVSIEMSKAPHLTRGRGSRKRGMNKPERLLLHKLYLIAWMLYSQHRNNWTMKQEIIERLRIFLPENILAELHPPPHLTSFLKSKQFVDGLRHAMTMWSDNFDILPPEDHAVPEHFDAFHAEIMTMQGSKPTLGQGFVALMRSIGLDARLVCSLQPPDNLNTTPTKIQSPYSSPSPIFWAEVWDPYANKWASVDPLTSTLRLPNRTKVKLKLEPPLSDSANIMRYCIAWNARNKARDVTRRYASNYNARVRKKRIPYADEKSDEWLNKLFSFFANHAIGNRDKDEMIELSKYPRLEGIPQRAQDFIGHPQYALLDQLHYNEVLREGAMHSGVLTLKNQKKPVYIYRRSDVLTCRTAQTWYRSYGRVIKPREQPVTHRSQTNRLTGEEEESGMYTFDQTEDYCPPQVDENGIVPKSQYRTIDLFFPHMLPKHATHIIDKCATKAAKLLKVDYANAIVKVEYGKRGAVSQYSGIVVAKQFAPAIVLVLKEYRRLEKLEAQQAESRRLFGLWRKIIVGIQIWERIEKMNPQRTEDTAHEMPAPGRAHTESTHSDSSNSELSGSDESFGEKDMDDIDDSDL